MYKISVILPVYNEEPYLEKCLDSICAQTLKEVEIICIDDGSTDNSLQILQNYAEKDGRIKILSQKNMFAGVARNNGMRCATGKYLSFLDSDDYYDVEMLEKMYQKAEEQNSDVVICRYREYCDKSGEITIPDWSYIDSFFMEKDSFSGGSLKYAGIFQITRGWAWDKLFKTDFIKQCNYEFPHFRSSEDGYFVYMLLLNAKNISYLNNILVTHRINNLNSLSNTREKNWINGFKMLHLIKEGLSELNIYSIYQQSFLNEVVNFLIGYVKSMKSFEIFRACYTYIRDVIEPELEILNHKQEYYFLKDYYEWYENVIRMPLSEYLFFECQNISRLLATQNVIMDQMKRSMQEKSWVFPFYSIKKGKVIVLYGAGKIGQSYYSQLSDSQFCKEIIWVDRKYKEHATKEKVVLNPEIVKTLKFDYVFIAIKDSKIQKNIKIWLIKQGVKLEQIRFYGNNRKKIVEQINDL